MRVQFQMKFDSRMIKTEKFQFFNSLIEFKTSESSIEAFYGPKNFEFHKVLEPNFKISYQSFF